MIRERQLATVDYVSGGTKIVELPKDSVYHWLTLSCFGGSFSTTQGVGGTGPTLVPGFPFSLIKQIRVLRNGSDVVASMSGEQLAKSHYYLNKSHPLARLYTVSTNVETVLTASVRGVTVPAISSVIGANMGGFDVVDNPSDIGTINFDFEVDLLFQMSPDDAYFGTLLDSRKLASFNVEINWATADAQIAAAGVTNTLNAASFSMGIMSIDQDDLKVNNEFGTFKRSQLSYSSFEYGSGNNQIPLPRGNFYHGMILGTRAYKAGSTANPIAENSVISTIEARVNTNYSLRKVDFRQLQAKNMADGGKQHPWALAEGHPQGFAYMSFHQVGGKSGELMPSYTMDIFDLQISTNAIGSATNGVSTAATKPVIDLLVEEIIPGVSIGGAAPRGSQAGSIGPGSAKPYSR